MAFRIGWITVLAVLLSGCVEMSHILGPAAGSSPVFGFNRLQEDDLSGNTSNDADDGDDDVTDDDVTDDDTTDDDTTDDDTTDDDTTDDDTADDDASDDEDSPIFGGIGDIPPLSGYETVTTDSGLTYIDIEVGQSDEPLPGARVTVNYVGWLTDGTEFDSGDAVQFGLEQVIAGWTEGVGSMRTGGRRRLLIPPDLAYGESGSPPSIPANATLVFDVDLLEFEN